jgi:hypothetical protein
MEVVYEPVRHRVNAGTTTNNANLQSQTITLSGLPLLQSYSYDEFNRLESATEMNGTTPSWIQTHIKMRYRRYSQRQSPEN